MGQQSALEDRLDEQLRSAGDLIPQDYVRQFKFASHLKRRFRSDFAWPEHRLIVEVEGGTWMQSSRHTSGPGYQADCKKYNLASVLGYAVLRFDSGMVRDGTALATIEDWFSGSVHRMHFGRDLLLV